MFYIKTRINDETTILTEITDENVFTRCPDCGEEFSVDLVEMIQSGGELFGTAVYCLECSEKIISRK
jgi:hypothetical protein